MEATARQPLAAQLSNQQEATFVPARRSAGKLLSIGAVCRMLKAEFPSISLSKLRYWESEGLLQPERSTGGYRRYSQRDVDRVRYILTMQADRYLPLKVIAEQLDAIDSGQVATLPSTPKPAAEITPAAEILTIAELVEAAGVTKIEVDMIRSAGVILPDAAGYYRSSDVELVKTAATLLSSGCDARLLKQFRMAADRQADLVATQVAPIAKMNNEGARGRAEEKARELIENLTSLHAALVWRAVEDQVQ